MAETDNGLPPISTDIGDQRICSFNIDKYDYHDSGSVKSIKSVVVDSADYRASVDEIGFAGVKSVLVNSEKAGRNFALFL